MKSKRVMQMFDAVNSLRSIYTQLTGLLTDWNLSVVLHKVLASLCPIHQCKASTIRADIKVLDI